MYQLTGLEAFVSHTKKDIESLYQQYGGMVFRRCQSLLNDEHRAKDALQDVFVQLLRNQGSIQPAGLSSLFYRMATNICLNMIRHQGIRDNHEREQELQHDITEQHDSSLETRFIELDRINKALSSFPKRTQEAAIYHFVDGFTMDEIALMMNMSNSNTRRILRELRQSVPQPEGAQ